MTNLTENRDTNPSYQDDYGKLFENLVFLWLRRKAQFFRGLLYYKEKKEYDFILFDRNKSELLVQAGYNFTDPDTRNREIDCIVGRDAWVNSLTLLYLIKMNKFPEHNN